MGVKALLSRQEVPDHASHAQQDGPHAGENPTVQHHGHLIHPECRCSVYASVGPPAPADPPPIHT